jgi:tripartite-type tricarboxylate transporter receptor subunit TctC
MLALDEFVLWVHADAPYKSAKEYVEAAKAAGAGKY